MKRTLVRRLTFTCLVVVLGSSVAERGGDVAPATASAARMPAAEQVRQRMSGLSIPFEANTGQTDARVAFAAHTAGGAVFVTRTGELVYSLPGKPLAGQGRRDAIRARGPGWVLTESLLGSHLAVRGNVPSATHISRFVGNDPRRWQASVPTFDRVALGEAWPGIEVELAARGNGVEKLFTVAPGADPRRIAISLQGATGLELTANGALVARTGNGPVSFTTPRAWQDIKGMRRPVRVAYALEGERYGFRLSGYDRAYPVVIDPVWQSTYLGRGMNDEARAIALDSTGNVFIAGFTASTNFPTTFGTGNGAQPSYGGGTYDVFVAKLTNDLKTLTGATYLGGSGEDEAFAIALDKSDNVFVTGYTASLNFPVTTNAAQSASGGGALDAFLVKLNNNLTSPLMQSTYLGGNGSEVANAIALDATGSNVFVAGYTTSGNFPITPGAAQGALVGSSNGFVAEYSNGSSMPLTHATFLGGSGGGSISGIAVDAGGNVFVAGTTSGSFPVSATAAQLNYGGGPDDAFVAKLNSTLTAPVTQATYLGGNGEDYGLAIALDTIGNNVFVAGGTTSTNFPVQTNSAQSGIWPGGLHDAFVARLNNNLTTSPSLRATYLGGSGDEYGTIAIAVDSAGNVFVAGGTASTDFPGRVNGAYAVYGGGSDDAFVARLKNDLTAPLTQSTYLGGSVFELARAIALDPTSPDVFVAGQTTSADFPKTFNGAQQNFGGGVFDDAFVSKLSHGLHDYSHMTANNDGDPHISTTDGNHYNFQSAGEFTALRDGPGMVIQTRQSPTWSFGPYWDSHTNLTTCVSLNTALAARVGRHRVTYEPAVELQGAAAGLQLRVDGERAAIPAGGLNLSGGGRVVQTSGAIEIDFPNGTILVVTPYLVGSQWLLNVDVSRTDATEGLMGAMAPGSWLPALPNGGSVGPMPAAPHQRFVTLNQTYADAWRVSNATSLFDYAPGTSTATFTNPGWPSESTTSCVAPLAPPKPIGAILAQAICRPIVDKTANANCVFDVAATGRAEFAKAYQLSQRIQQGGTVTEVSGNLVATNGPTTSPAAFFNATVARLAGGGPTPSGTVQFILDGEKTGETVRLDRTGMARSRATYMKPGAHRLSASYLPAEDSVFLPSTSAETNLLVRTDR